MAARKRLRLTDEHRKKIQTTMLIKRLSDHIVGKVEMSATQVNAAKILLGKALPDLSAVEMQADVETRPAVTDKPMTAEEWQQQHGEQATTH